MGDTMDTQDVMEIIKQVAKGVLPEGIRSTFTGRATEATPALILAGICS